MTARLIAVTACVSLSAFAAPAFAQTAASWTGFYTGGGVGYSEQSGNDGELVLFDTNRDGVFGDTVRTGAGVDAFSPGFCNGGAMGRTPADGCRFSDGNLNLSLRAGYDWQVGSWVFGGVIDIAQVRLGEDVTAFSTTPASYTFARDLESTVALRARGGYAFDRYLAYGTAGFVRGEIDHSFSTTNTVNSFTLSNPDDTMGYQVGAGIEMLWGEHLSFGLEYLYTSIEDDEFTVDVGPGTSPITSPFRIVNPAGTFFSRDEDEFDYDTISATIAWRY